MTHETRGDITVLLHGVAEGRASAADELFPLVYQQLRALAVAYFRNERPDHTLQPTAIVHEAYVKLVGSAPVNAQGRDHFFAVAARVIRQLLVDHARTKNRQKRGGGRDRVTLDQALTPMPQDPLDLLALDEALDRLRDLNARSTEVVVLRFFGGLDCAAVAGVMGISNATVVREWRFARAWLMKELADRAES